MAWSHEPLRVDDSDGIECSRPVQFGDGPVGLFLDTEELSRLHLLIEMTICSVRSLDESHVADAFIIKPLQEFVRHIKACNGEECETDGTTG